MSEQNLPKEPSPLSAWEYWQESMRVWADFSKRTGQIVMGQIETGSDGSKKLDADADTLATEFLRTLSDVYLRHWQNTARLLEGYPAWIQIPNNMTGSALVDWFDSFQRQAGNKVPAASTASAGARSETEARPKTLAMPDGKADDLTRIKGIGPKLSGRLNALGIFHYKQIAAWSDEQANWVDNNFSYKGRVVRESWVSQARVLSANGSSTLH